MQTIQKYLFLNSVGLKEFCALGKSKSKTLIQAKAADISVKGVTEFQSKELTVQYYIYIFKSMIFNSVPVCSHLSESITRFVLSGSLNRDSPNFIFSSDIWASWFLKF